MLIMSGVGAQRHINTLKEELSLIGVVEEGATVLYFDTYSENLLSYSNLFYAN